jgi:hypothetical protein
MATPLANRNYFEQYAYISWSRAFRYFRLMSWMCLCNTTLVVKLFIGSESVGSHHQQRNHHHQYHHQFHCQRPAFLTPNTRSIISIFLKNFYSHELCLITRHFLLRVRRLRASRRLAVAYCTCVFGLIKMKFRRLIVVISDDVLCCSVLRGRRLIWQSFLSVAQATVTWLSDRLVSQE